MGETRLSLEAVLERSYELQIKLEEVEESAEKVKIIREYIELCCESKQPVLPEFEKDWEWFNTARPLMTRFDLSGKIVVLDFFTYCCINCIHILPDLEQLERSISPKDGLLVIGVHSAKFENEKVSANILSAILRYNISHPVVNDSEASLWHQLQVACWPTQVILGPLNQILFTVAGEGHADLVRMFVTEAIDFHGAKGEMRIGADVDFLSLERSRLGPNVSTLRFPGKLSWHPSGKKLAISDTGQHRIVITDNHGVVQKIIGSGKPGLKDGASSEAMFCNPQGLAWREDVLYVADTDNHCIRQIDIDANRVSTIAGTGVQGNDKEGGKTGSEQPISSPWDLTLGSSLSGKNDVLLIAMAGTHQIWVYFLEEAQWIKNRYKASTCVRFAGSGLEENRNNNYPHRAGFAQPSGITLGKIGDKSHLFIADAESSSVRTVSLTDGAVKGLVGGDRDPTNLFAFGDADGIGVRARLQHPLGVALRDNGSTLYVADSYNHKIKKVNIAAKECVTVLAGNAEGAPNDLTALNEPGGICMHPTKDELYIADTNNHCIKILDVESNLLSQFPVIKAADPVRDSPDRSIKKETTLSIGPPKSIVTKNHIKIPLPDVSVHPGGQLILKLDLQLADSLHLTDEAPSMWQILSKDELGRKLLDKQDMTKNEIDNLSNQPSIILELPRDLTNNHTCLDVECVLYYCGEDGACRMKGIVFSQSVHITSESVDRSVAVSLTQIFT